MADPIAEARTLLSQSRRHVVFTGAGVSADSGVPTFRGVAGASGDTFWGKYDPMQLASPRGFRADPKLVYDWYNWRRSQLANIQPNHAHHAIARLQAARNAVLITQNVDGLHERVAPSGAVIHRVHGTISADRCMNANCGHTEQVNFNNLPPLRDCPKCRRERMRPAVVWFGEALDQALWQLCLRACEGADVLLVVGTSGEVYPAAGLVDVAANAGAKVILANLEPGPLDAVADIAFHAKAAEIIPQLIN
jgi:NAD-dependent deacetylase